MKRSRGLVALVFLAGAGGCVAPPDPIPGPAASGAARTAPGREETAARTPAARGASGGRGERPVQLPAYRVQEWAFSDFGMSVKTNFEVVTGGRIQWMEVSALEPGGSAAARGLTRGDRILALDGTPVTDLYRASLLEKLFQRKKGESVRLLVMGGGDPLPRFIVLVGGPP